MKLWQKVQIKEGADQYIPHTKIGNYATVIKFIDESMVQVQFFDKSKYMVPDYYLKPDTDYYGNTVIQCPHNDTYVNRVSRDMQFTFCRDCRTEVK